MLLAKGGSPPAAIGASMRSGIPNNGLSSATATLLLIGISVNPAEASAKRNRTRVPTVEQVIASKTGSVQLITFPETGWNSVRVVRGRGTAKNNDGEKPPAEKADTAEIVRFDDSAHGTVRVMRGDTVRTTTAREQPRQTSGMRSELVSFADPRERPVAVLRGSGMNIPETELFGPASIADLERVAFA